MRADSNDRQPWDVGRFVKTVLYFNPPPSPAAVIKTLFIDQPAKAIRGALNVVTPMQPTEPSTATANSVAVTGVTSPVGRRIIAGLLRQGRSVKAMCTDKVQKENAQTLLGSAFVGAGGNLDFVDLQLSELSDKAMSNIQSVVYCSPNTPISARDMSELGRLLGTLPKTEGHLIYTPSSSMQKVESSRSAAEQTIWGPLDDVVMGGVSDSLLMERFEKSVDGPVGVFTGTVSTSNNGGFASVRTRNFSPPLNLSAYDGVYLRLKGDGKRYKLILRSDPSWDGIGYTASFDTIAGQWQTIHVPFSACVPVFRARTLKNASPLDTCKITSIQLMLSKFEYDGALNPRFSPGRFELPIQKIGAYLAQPIAPRFIMISNDGNEEAENIVRSSDVPYTIIRPAMPILDGEGEALTNRKLIIGQGEDLQGKSVESSEVAEVAIASLSQPRVTGTTFQVASVVLPDGQDGQNRDWWGELAKACLVGDK